MWKLFVLFTVVPAVELFLLLQLGSFFGPMPTFLFVLGTGVLGAWLAKREGFSVLRQLQADLGKGLPPATRLVEGGLVLAGGLLLITPGVLTDITGILLLVPPVRRFLAPRILTWIGSSATISVAAAPVPTPFTSKFDS